MSGLQRRLRQFCMVAVWLLALVALPMAQDFVDAIPPDQFYEEFDEVPNVSGGQLLGLRIESASAWSGVEAPVFFTLPEISQEICVRVATQDGRFRAINAFSLPETSESRNIRLVSLTQEYRPRLSQYLTEEIAVRAYFAGDAGCSAHAAVNIPVAAQLNETPEALVLYINSGGLAVAAELYAAEPQGSDGGDPFALATCGPSGQSGRIAYNTRCRFDLADTTPGVHWLRLEFDDGFETSHIDTRVALPGGPSVAQ